MRTELFVTGTPAFDDISIGTLHPNRRKPLRGPTPCAAPISQIERKQHPLCEFGQLAPFVARQEQLDIALGVHKR